MEDTRKVFADVANRETVGQSQGIACVEMPRYRCHKEVWALKIKEIHLDSDAAMLNDNRETDGTAIMIPEDGSYAPIRLDAAYVRKHNPQAGGYYVVYKGGYKSWSPAVEFEEGYARI